MSRRDVLLLLADILESVEKVERYIAGMTREQFVADDLIVDAVVRNLEVIGEAARQIPPDWRARYAEIQWRRVVGFRNIVVHEYFAVDPSIAWVIATTGLAELKPVLRRMIADARQKRGDS